MESKHLAIDLGAESGRAVVGTLSGGQLRMTEVHRFPNKMLPVRGHFHWNVYDLYANILESLAKAPEEVESIGIDTWGVDFGILDESGHLMGLPFAYRDARHPKAMDSFLGQMPKKKLYDMTGTELLPFNSLFQLEACRTDAPLWLEKGASLLFMPDLLSYLLCGVAKTEYTFASTSQLMDPRTGKWEPLLFEAVGARVAMMQQIVPSGTALGPLSPDVSKASGNKHAGVPVVAVASHDTASAAAAIPAEGTGWGFISSGTWSIMGIETDRPIINDASFEAGFTNEGSASGRILLMKNIMGLWLVQGVRRAWQTGGEVSYPVLAQMAAEAEPFAALVDPDRQTFLNPEDMVAAFHAECVRTGQPFPDSRGGTVRSILESIALKYRYVRDQLLKVGQTPIDRIHLIGGGSQNRLLCQFAANAMGIPVIAGPAEATAAGNLLVQAVAMGRLPSFDSIRDVMRASSDLVTFEPKDTMEWDSQYERFLRILEV